jgi:hypothetical protein
MDTFVSALPGRNLRSFGLPAPSFHPSPLRMTRSKGFEEPVRLYEVRWQPA